MSFPDEIETERLTLRPLRPSEAGPMALYAGDARVAKMLTRAPYPYPPGAAEAFIEGRAARRASECAWAMDGRKSGEAEFIGVIGLRAVGGRATLDYWVGPPFWNTGYATEAAGGAVEAAKAAGLAGLDAELMKDNEASAHVLAHIGFVETGLKESFSVARGGMASMRVFALDFAGAGD